LDEDPLRIHELTEEIAELYLSPS